MPFMCFSSLESRTPAHKLPVLTNGNFSTEVTTLQINEGEFHLFFGCPLFNRPRIILQNVISSVAPFSLRTLLYGVDEFDFTENKKIINETLKFIHENKTV